MDLETYLAPSASIRSSECQVNVVGDRELDYDCLGPGIVDATSGVNRVSVA